MIPENKFQSPTPEKVPDCANLPPGKIEKFITKGFPGLSIRLCRRKMK